MQVGTALHPVPLGKQDHSNLTVQAGNNCPTELGVRVIVSIDVEVAVPVIEAACNTLTCPPVGPTAIEAGTLGS